MRYYFTVFFVFISFLSFAQKHEQSLIDSLTQKLSLTKEDTNKVNLLDKLSYCYSTIDPDKGVQYGEAAMKLSQQLNWKSGVAKANADLGINYQAKSDYTRALEYNLQALKLSEELNKRMSIAGNLANISLVYLSQSDYSRMLEYAFKALKIYEEQKDKKHIGILSENIGTAYFEQKKYSKTIEYYNAALKNYYALGNKNDIARGLGNKGMVLDAKGNYRKALNNHLKALSINKALGNKKSTQINIANIGLVYFHLKNYPDALKYQLKALKISEEIKAKTSIAINLGNIGETYFVMAKEKKDTSLQQKSIFYLEKAISVCKEINFAGPLIEFGESLTEAYSFSGNYKKAFEHYKEYSMIKDSVFSTQNQLHIANLEASREIERKNKELEIKDAQLQVKEMMISKKHYEHLIYSFSIVLLLLMVGIAIKSLYNYKKSNQSLLREKQKQLTLMNKQVELLKAQTKTLQEISYIQAHDVRGPVATILGLIQLFNFNDFTDETNKIVIEGISDVTTQLDIAVKEVIKKEVPLNSE